MPGIDGVELCYQLLKFTDVPILFMNCKSEDVDKVIGLSAGGDDYITKPFSPIELVARVKAHLRRNHLNSSSQQGTNETTTNLIKFQNLEINLYTQSVLIQDFLRSSYLIMNLSF
jgi:DNA-binding response OmpR family regulator